MSMVQPGTFFGSPDVELIGSGSLRPPPLLSSTYDSDDDDGFTIVSTTFASPSLAVASHPAPHTGSFPTPSSHRRRATPSVSPEWDTVFEGTSRSTTTGRYSGTDLMLPDADDPTAAVGHHRTSPPAWHRGSLCTPIPAGLVPWRVIDTVPYELTVVDPLSMCSSTATVEIVSASMPVAALPPVVAVPPLAPSSSVDRVYCCPSPTVGYFTLQGPRGSQEDATHFEPQLFPVDDDDDSRGAGLAPTFFAAVYDGHNGAGAATAASELVHEYIRAGPHFATDLPRAMVDGLRATDQAMADQDGCRSSGTTALVACVRDGFLAVANLGDCRAVLVLTDGSVVDLSVDHKPTAVKEAARIAAAGGSVAAGRVSGLGVSRGLADYRFKPLVSNVADVTTLKLNSRCACLLLATDGLWDRMSSAEAGAFLHSALGVQDPMQGAPSSQDPRFTSAGPATPRNTVGQATARLVQHAVHDLGAADNVTAVCLSFVA